MPEVNIVHVADPGWRGPRGKVAVWWLLVALPDLLWLSRPSAKMKINGRQIHHNNTVTARISENVTFYYKNMSFEQNTQTLSKSLAVAVRKTVDVFFIFLLR